MHGEEVANKLVKSNFNLLPLNKIPLAPNALHQSPPQILSKPIQSTKIQQDSSPLISNSISHPLEPSIKRLKVLPAPTTENFDKKLGTYISHDLKLLHELGWKGLVHHRS